MPGVKRYADLTGNREKYRIKSRYGNTLAIEYGSDVLIGLQFKGMEDDEEKKTEETTKDYKTRDPRQVQLKILKNRSYKLPDEPLNFDFYAKFNYFEDVDF